MNDHLWFLINLYNFRAGAGNRACARDYLQIPRVVHRKKKQLDLYDENYDYYLYDDDYDFENYLKDNITAVSERNSSIHKESVLEGYKRVRDSLISNLSEGFLFSILPSANIKNIFSAIKGGGKDSYSYYTEGTQSEGLKKKNDLQLLEEDLEFSYSDLKAADENHEVIFSPQGIQANATARPQVIHGFVTNNETLEVKKKLNSSLEEKVNKGVLFTAQPSHMDTTEVAALESFNPWHSTHFAINNKDPKTSENNSNVFSKEDSLFTPSTWDFPPRSTLKIYEIPNVMQAEPSQNLKSSVQTVSPDEPDEAELAEMVVDDEKFLRLCGGELSASHGDQKSRPIRGKSVENNYFEIRFTLTD